MAGGVTASTGGGRRGRGRRFRPRGDINVTPFVDVMLVLLVIFMVSAPLMTVGVPLELPKTTAKALNLDKEPLTVSVDAQGRVFLQNTEMTLDGLIPKLQAIAENGYDQRIYVRGDLTVGYGRVMEVLGALNAAGYRKVGLLTDQKKRAAQP
ncbi:MAG TPA: protein TolR [Alphaproteobacteria bacterium]|nr:protein TolR [Alphaproteobacteria bacterium]HAJ46921.1 protein TolR [Alphaproteobacteria bacterium]